VIKESIKNKRTRDIITKICDSCGKEERKALSQVLYSRNRKKIGKDYCKECCYKHREHGQKVGPESPYWKNGLSINPTSGYLRINKTGEYLHKYLYSEFIGRKLTRKEQVHHIDMDKLNNEIKNFFLCQNKSNHHKIHFQMEKLGYKLLKKYIWYDERKKKYILDEHYKKNINFYIIERPTACFKWRSNGKKYNFIYVSYRKHKTYSRYVIEKFLNRELKKYEMVHHINGNTLDDDINNLDLLTKSSHRNAHNSLQECIAELYKRGTVKFIKGKYVA